MISLAIKVPQGMASCPMVFYQLSQGQFQWLLCLVVTLFKEMDSVFLECAGQNRPCHFGNKTWSGFCASVYARQ